MNEIINQLLVNRDALTSPPSAKPFVATDNFMEPGEGLSQEFDDLVEAIRFAGNRGAVYVRADLVIEATKE